MANDRSYEEDVMYWLGWENGEEPEEGLSPLLPHLSDIEIIGLGDSYDDGRIDTLTQAYIDVRQQLAVLRRENDLLLLLGREQLESQKLFFGQRHDAP